VPFHRVLLFTHFSNDGGSTLLVDQRMPEALKLPSAADLLVY
jgi:hypothetical protein